MRLIVSLVVTHGSSGVARAWGFEPPFLVGSDVVGIVEVVH